MSQLYLLSGAFLTGVSLAGLISFSARAFPALRGWGFWMVVVIAIAFFLAAILDDYLCKFLGISYQAYVSMLAAIAAVIFVGGLIQWL